MEHGDCDMSKIHDSEKSFYFLQQKCILFLFLLFIYFVLRKSTKKGDIPFAPNCG